MDHFSLHQLLKSLLKKFTSALHLSMTVNFFSRAKATSLWKLSPKMASVWSVTEICPGKRFNWRIFSLGMFISINEADGIHISMHCQLLIIPCRVIHQYFDAVQFVSRQCDSKQYDVMQKNMRLCSSIWRLFLLYYNKWLWHTFNLPETWPRDLIIRHWHQLKWMSMLEK